MNITDNAENGETITLGGGCFWCTEAVYVRLKGVLKTIPGYSGGKIQNPSYEQVSTGKTGHAEAVQVTFDPKIIELREILEIFFATHDPTTLNRQGADVGTQYRSVIFYHGEEQRKISEEYIKELESKNIYDNAIVTKLEPFENFYPAEEYHLRYYENNKNQPYSKYVIAPKIDEFEHMYRDKLSKM